MSLLGNPFASSDEEKEQATLRRIVIDLTKAAAAAQKCYEDFSQAHGYLAWISAACAIGFVVVRHRNRSLRVFPDNLITLYVFVAALLEMVIGITILTDGKVLTSASASLRALCIFQGAGFQFLALSLIILWLTILIIMYQVVVVQARIANIRKQAHMYYGATFTLPVLTTVGLWATDSFGPLPPAMICYLPQKLVTVRFAVLYGFYPPVWFSGVFMTWRITRVLLRTGWNSAATEHCRLVSKAYIIQIIGFTVYLLWFMVITWLYGFNSIIVEYYPYYASYLARTTYTYCGAGVVSLSIIGLVSAIVFGGSLWPSKSDHRGGEDREKDNSKSALQMMATRKPTIEEDTKKLMPPSDVTLLYLPSDLEEGEPGGKQYFDMRTMRKGRKQKQEEHRGTAKTTSVTGGSSSSPLVLRGDTGTFFVFSPSYSPQAEYEVRTPSGGALRSPAAPHAV